MKYIKIRAILFLITVTMTGFAQTNSFSLKQAVDYALQNNLVAKNAMIDAEITEVTKKELRSKALPQVDAGIDYLHNFRVQKIILENGVIAAFSDPKAPVGSVEAFQLQLNNVVTGSITASLAIYDGALKAGIANAGVYTELADKNLQQTKIGIADAVTKAYYGVLVTQKQLDFLQNNLGRIDSLYRETQAKYKSGLVRKIDVDRIEVQFNNLKEEKEKANKIVLLNKAFLLFQMNINPTESIVLTDTLNEAVLTRSESESANFDPSTRIESSILKTKQQISKTETNMIKGGYTPRVSAYATSGYNPAATNLGDIFQSSRYYNYTYVGLKVNMPIFHGFEKRYKLQNKSLSDLKLENSVKSTEQSINLEVQQANINLSNNIESLKTQKRNLDLAQENVRIVRIENQKGVSTNIEVTNAEGDLKEAQTNYYNTLYQALVSKTNLDKATGRLLLND
jgi:outer membrane protein